MSETSFFAQSTSPILVVVLGIVFAQVLLNPTNVLTNSQVAGRISPTLTDLAAAVATGFAGAIAITRRDVGDVVPGVAIAISLVPPLAVVGVCLGSGASSLAVGALILFASNVVAMVITSTVVLVIAGFAQESRIVDSPGRGRVYVLLASALIIVAIPMVLNSLSSLWERQIHDAAEQWLTFCSRCPDRVRYLASRHCRGRSAGAAGLTTGCRARTVGRRIGAMASAHCCSSRGRWPHRS